MTTFWKFFGIFWIIFLVWYLTGGPQRVTINGAKPITTFDLDNATAVAESSNNNTLPSFSGPEPRADNPSSSQPQPEKSFSSQPKTNTINVTN